MVYNSHLDPTIASYVQHLTPYAFKFVEKQLSLTSKVKLNPASAAGMYEVESSEGKIEVSSDICECTF